MINLTSYFQRRQVSGDTCNKPHCRAVCGKAFRTSSAFYSHNRIHTYESNIRDIVIFVLNLLSEK